MPLSYGDAKPILASMGGDPVPASWVGGLNASIYKFGPGRRVMLTALMKSPSTTIWNVCARLNGTEEPDRYVILGI